MIETITTLTIEMTEVNINGYISIIQFYGKLVLNGKIFNLKI